MAARDLGPQSRSAPEEQAVAGPSAAVGAYYNQEVYLLFKDACEELQKWMFPVVVASRQASGRLSTSVSAGILINEDGWLMTAGHVLQKYAELDQATKQHHNRQNDIEGKVVAIKANKKWSSRQKNRKIKQLGNSASGVTNVAFVFLSSNVRVSLCYVDPVADLGVCKLEGLKPPVSYVPPKFRADTISIGEMWCRAGFPFYTVEAKWNKGSGGFAFNNLYPVPLFVNEALVSQFVDVIVEGQSKPPPYTRKWVRTSAPGLKGQSGGPLVDPDGRICAVQVKTESLPLDFSPSYKGRQEHQFLNVGLAACAETACGFLSHHNVVHFTS